MVGRGVMRWGGVFPCTETRNPSRKFRPHWASVITIMTAAAVAPLTISLDGLMEGSRPTADLLMRFSSPPASPTKESLAENEADSEKLHGAYLAAIKVCFPPQRLQPARPHVAQAKITHENASCAGPRDPRYAASGGGQGPCCKEAL